MSNMEIIELAEQPTAVVRAKLPMAELPGLFDRAYHAVFAAAAAQGAQVTGPPFGYYPSMPGDLVEVEAGVPLNRPIATEGDVEPGLLPGGRLAHTVHVGSYEDLPKTYARLQEWVAAQGLALAVGMWEVYLTDPSAEPDQAKWRTEIFWRLQD